MCWTALCCTDLRRRGGVGGPASGCPRRRPRSPEAAVGTSRNRRKSEKCVLRRFPVSDEFILSWQTFCVILDRKEIFEISDNGFFEVGHVTTENMEMSEMALRIDWKCSRVSAGPASGRNRRVKCGMDRISAFCRV